MAYKFEDLEVWQRALDYADQIHEVAEQLPKHERYNLAGTGPRTTDTPGVLGRWHSQRRGRRFAECQFAGISLKTIQISRLKAYGL